MKRSLPLPSLEHLLERLRGSTIQRDLRPFTATLQRVQEYGRTMAAESDSQLQSRAAELAGRARDGTPLDDLLPEHFALVREVAERTIGLRPFDMQMLAGLALYRGKLAEMQTGEGKTLAAVAPVAFRALTGQGAHVLTFNDYLAHRDAAWMGPVYRFLGLTVGVIQEGMSHAERAGAYACDVTYSTAKEAGFDFLRDQLATDPAHTAHRGFHFAVVDEADSILIDEARIPLVIAGAVEAPDDEAGQMADVVRSLEPGRDYDMDGYQRNVHLTEQGLAGIEGRLGCGHLHDAGNLHLLTQLNMALHAHVLMHRNVDYIVRDGRVEIVDEFTGRVVEDRHWPDGLQAAVEAKERVRRRADGAILGSITIQHFLEQYEHLSGMTATACPAEEELAEFYGLGVAVVPPNRPCVRRDEPDLIFTHREAKHRALVRDIAAAHRRGRPVLVGTASVAESEELGSLLESASVPCRILNARNDSAEAEIIAEAGAAGAVTISTNMAGRGTDIHLGGRDETQRAAVADLGGLWVIGTNRHESRRIDDQLRGRAGRQGDPGASRFYVGLDDPLIQRYRIDELIPEHYRREQEEPVDHPVVRREIDRAQRIVEGQNFEIRRTLWGYSQFVEKQRRLVQARRAEVLRGDELPLSGVNTALYRARCDEVGRDVVDGAARQIALHHLDTAWRLHLARIAEIRDGIHLVGLGGLNPLDEFHKVARDSLDDHFGNLDQAIAATFRSVAIGPTGLDLDGEGLRGPSSTWTYLVNDDAMANHLANVLMGTRNVGMNAAAGIMWPLLGLWIAARRLTQRRQS